MVLDITKGGTLRTALAKVIGASLLWHNRVEGPKGLGGYKGATMDLDRFLEVLRTVLYIDLSPGEFDALSNYYIFDGNVNWKIILGDDLPQ